MKVQVTVKLQSRKERVEKLNDTEYRVFVNVPPVDGKANQAVIRLLAEFFDVPKSRLKIVHGQKGRKKLIEID